MNKKKSSLMTYLVFILAFGLISTILNSDIPFGAMIQNWENYDLEVLLEYFNLGLGFLVFVLVAIILFYRIATEDKDQNIKPGREEDREEKF